MNDRPEWWEVMTWKQQQEKAESAGEEDASAAH